MTLEAVLTQRQRELPWRELRNRLEWAPGWASSAPPRALVVGAGLAGLSCATALRAAGWHVSIVDKSRGAGGRASTRRVGALRFDHGAQVLTPRDPRFVAWTQEWEAKGYLARWVGDRVSLRPGQVLGREPACARLVGAPGMSSPIRELAREAGVRFGWRVEALRRDARGWWARSAQGEELGPFAQVVLATPTPQAALLLDPVAPTLAAAARRVEFAPCWAGLIAFAQPLPVDWDSAQVEDSPLIWVARDSSKPGRPADGPECWVLHASEAWSEAHLERDPAWVAQRLEAALRELTPEPWPEVVHLDAHRWRYANPKAPLGSPYLNDPGLGLSLCGDGCLGPRLESAYLSGLTLGEHLAASRADPTH